MPVNDFGPITPIGQVKASELRRLGHEVRAQDKITGSGPVGVRRDGAGFQVQVDFPLVFWAKITGSSAGTPAPHSWTQQLENPDGSFSDDPEGRTGTTTIFPAYALDGGTTASGHIVRLYLAQGGEFFLFDPGMAGAAGSSLTVEQISPTFIVSNTTTLAFDHVDGFVVTGSAGIAQVNIVSASDTQRGIVSLVAQTLGAGDKRFTDNVNLTSGNNVFWDDGSDGSQGTIVLVTTSAGANSATMRIPQTGSNSVAQLEQNGGGSTFFLVGQSNATRGNVFYSVNDATGESDGITQTSLDFVDVVGGIVVAGSGGIFGVPFKATPMAQVMGAISLRG